MKRPAIRRPIQKMTRNCRMKLFLGHKNGINVRILRNAFAHVDRDSLKKKLIDEKEEGFLVSYFS